MTQLKKVCIDHLKAKKIWEDMSAAGADNPESIMVRNSEEGFRTTYTLMIEEMQKAFKDDLSQ